MSLRKQLSQAGDTIVEVMFAVAVVGMVIGGSYVIATRALRTGRYAQEQTEALKEAESQIEKLKYSASLGLRTDLPIISSENIFDPSAGRTTFCINDNFNKILVSQAANYATDCQGRGNGKLYTVLVTYTPNPSFGATDLFNVKVTWERQGTDTPGVVQVAYRLHNAPAPAS